MSWWKRLGDWIDRHDKHDEARNVDNDIWSQPAPCSICGKPGRFQMGDAFCPDHAPGCSQVEAGPNGKQLSLTTDGFSAEGPVGDWVNYLENHVRPEIRILKGKLEITRIDRDQWQKESREWEGRCAEKDKQIADIWQDVGTRSAEESAIVRDVRGKLDFYETREHEHIGVMAILRRDLDEVTNKLTATERALQSALAANRAARRKRSKSRSGAKR